MGQCKCSVPSVEEDVSRQQFRAMDANKNNKACRIEMGDYVASHPELWAMLSVNLSLSEDECRKTATRVAMELATGLKGEEAMKAEITEAQFHTFRTRFLVGKGAQEFFHRCVFASFDADGNHAMDSDELDAFLDTFYKSGSIFEGDARLPPVEELKERIIGNSKSYSKTGKLTFEEIRDVLKGKASATSSLNGASNHNRSIAGTAESFSDQTSRHTTTSLSQQQPQDNSDNNNIKKSSSHSKNKFAAPEAAPEKTPEPRIKAADLSPPSLEFKPSTSAAADEVEEVPEQTPEVQLSLSTSLHGGKPTSSPAARKKKQPPRRSKSDVGDTRSKSRSRSGSPGAGPRRIPSRSRPSIGDFIEKNNASSLDVNARSKSPSRRGRKKNSSTEEGENDNHNNGTPRGRKSRSPSARAKRNSEGNTSSDNMNTRKSRSPSGRAISKRSSRRPSASGDAQYFM